jgi:hypothetical protein
VIVTTMVAMGLSKPIDYVVVQTVAGLENARNELGFWPMRLSCIFVNSVEGSICGRHLLARFNGGKTLKLFQIQRPSTHKCPPLVRLICS